MSEGTDDARPVSRVLGRNIEALHRIRKAAIEESPLAERIADGITRFTGSMRFVVLHVLVPAEWTVAQGHHLAHQVEDDIRAAVPGAGVSTHVEPLGWRPTMLEVIVP